MVASSESEPRTSFDRVNRNSTAYATGRDQAALVHVPQPVAAAQIDGPLWLMALPIALTAFAFWPITRNYFFGDDLLAMYDTIHKPLLRNLFEPYGGHVMATRNLVYLLLYSLFGLSPSAYFLVVLLTHLVNVGLLFLVIRGLTGARLACFGATLWGAASINQHALGWYQVYGAVLAVTAQLWIVYRLVRIGRTGHLTRLEVLSWGLLLLAASTCFGTGIAITVAMPGVAWLLLPATPARRRATIGLALSAACVAVGYLGYQQLARYLFPDLPWISVFAALRNWQTVASLAGLMMMHGMASLLLGPLAHHAIGGGSLEWALTAAALVAIGTAFVVGSAAARRIMLACLLPFGIGYFMIAAGRAAFWSMAGMNLVTQGHYHYTAPLTLAILTPVALAEFERFWRPRAAVANLILTLWLMTFAAAQSIAGRPINNHNGARALANKALEEIKTLALSQPEGSNVYIRNRLFFGVGPFEIKSPHNFPGMAGLFAVYYPDQLLEGRRVFFVEQSPRVLKKLRNRSFRGMLVPPGAAPADRILNLRDSAVRLSPPSSRRR
jgi:hypothetical protein